MARLTELRNAEAITAMTRVAHRVSREAGRAWAREVRAAGAPVVRDARARFKALGGARNDTTARTVRMRVTTRAVGWSMSGRNHPWGAPKEFGAKRDETRYFSQRLRGGALWEGRRRVPYSAPTMFGRWTGNQHTTRLRDLGIPAGKAFYPAIVEGIEDTIRRLEDLADQYIDILARGMN